MQYKYNLTLDKENVKIYFSSQDYKQWNNNWSPNNKQIIDTLTSGTILGESRDRKKKTILFVDWK
jgi:hypothetical protein